MEKKKPVRAEAVKAAVKETVAETKEAGAAVVKAAAAEAKEATAAVKAAAAETKESGAAAVKAAVAEKKEQTEKAKEVEKMKKTTRTAKKVKAVQEELKPEIVLQFQGKEALVAEAIDKAKAAFVADGHRMSSIKSLQIYLKPEEYAAYYVINQKVAGKVDLF